MMENKQLDKITKWLGSFGSDGASKEATQANNQQANAGIYLAAFLASNVNESVVDEAIDLWNKRETKPDNLTRALHDGSKDGSHVYDMGTLKDLGG